MSLSFLDLVSASTSVAAGKVNARLLPLGLVDSVMVPVVVVVVSVIVGTVVISEERGECRLPAGFEGIYTAIGVAKEEDR